MPLLRPSRLLTTPRAHLQILSRAQRRPFSSSSPQNLTSTTSLRAEDTHAHEDHYDPPSGWLFGVKPGEKYENEGWEYVWYYGFMGSLLFGVVGYCYKPDTSIQTWALEEARRRLEAEGILEDPDNKKR